MADASAGVMEKKGASKADMLPLRKCAVFALI